MRLHAHPTCQVRVVVAYSHRLMIFVIETLNLIPAVSGYGNISTKMQGGLATWFGYAYSILGANYPGAFLTIVAK